MLPGGLADAVEPSARPNLAMLLQEANRLRRQQAEKYAKDIEEIALMSGKSTQELLHSVSTSQNGSEFVLSFSNSYSDENPPNSSAHASSLGSSNPRSNSKGLAAKRSRGGLDHPIMPPTVPPIPDEPLEVSPIAPVPLTKRSALRDVTTEKKAPRIEDKERKYTAVATPVTRKSSPPKPESPPKSASKSTNKRIIRIKDRTYMMQKVIGKGGSCQVFEAKDASNEDIRVAVKIVDLTDCNERMKRIYLNEVKILEELQGNDYVVKLISYETKQSKLYVVMELGERSLAAFIEEVKHNRRVDEHFLRYHWAEMLRCVNTIHQKNIIHSDLKPANFLLVNGRLKLIDFGIAAKITDREESVIQDGGMGTPNYMSPEAVGFRFDNRTAFEITLKSDVWSLGCILYALIHGRTPFSHISSNSMKINAIKNMKIDFDKVEDHQLRDTLKKCFERDPLKRPTVQDLLQHPYLNSRSSNENLNDVTLADSDYLKIVEQIQNNTPKTAARTMKALCKDLKNKSTH